MRRQHAFTLIELMVVVAVLAIIATLAAPSLRDFILMQRLKSINAQIVTDLQLARSEAASRNTLVHLRFQSDASGSCYVISTGTRNACSCLSSPPCTAEAREVRTVRVTSGASVRIAIPEGQAATDFAFDPATGGIHIPTSDARSGAPQQFNINAAIDTARTLRTVVSLSGRPSVCRPANSSMPVPECD
jgi:type IV fimbrial biogenesis protein FimT